MPDFDDFRLNGMFDEFRREVTPFVTPPGTAAARRRVRRRRKTTVAAIATGAVLVVGGPAAGFVAASQNTPTPPPIGPTELPTPIPTTAPTAAPTATPTRNTETSTPPAEPELPKVTGKVFYLGMDGKIHLNGRTYPGGDVASVNVSPDGRQLSWVEDGVLMFSDLDGENRRETQRDVDGVCVEPVWSTDSSRVLLTRSDPQGPQLLVMYLSGGAGDYLDPIDGCHYRWSADDERIAFFDGRGESVTVQNLVGGGERVTLDRDVIGGRYYVDVVGISANADRVCVATTGQDGTLGDAARTFRCDTVIDVSARKVVDLPIDGELTSAVFTADGGMLARVKTDNGSELLRLDAKDRVVARTVESKADAERELMSYLP